MKKRGYEITDAGGNTINYNPMRDVNLVRLLIMPTEWGDNPEMVGNENYRELLTDPEVWRKFITTAKYVVLSVGGEMILGFSFALLLQTKFKGRGIIYTLLVLPMTMSPVIVGLMWKLFLDPNWGMFNYVLGLGRVDWAGNPNINLYAIVMTDIWMWTPFVMLLSMAGLSAPPLLAMELYNQTFLTWKTSYGSALGYIMLIIIIAITSIFVKYLNKARQ